MENVNIREIEEAAMGIIENHQEPIAADFRFPNENGSEEECFPNRESRSFKIKNK